MSSKPEKPEKSKVKTEKKRRHKKDSSTADEVSTEKIAASVEDTLVEKSSTPPHEELEPIPKLKSYPSSVPQLPEDEEVTSVQQTNLQEEDAFSKINPETLNSFGKVFEYAKNLGISFAKPEFVLIGKKGTGKTTLVESLLRQAKLNTESNERVVMVQTIYKEDDTPFVLKKDFSNPEYDKDMKLSADEIEEALNARIRVASEGDSVVLNCSTKAMYPITFIDTTGNEDEKQIEELLKPSNRFALVVINCCNIAESEDYIALLKKLDPSASRSFFIYTHFNEIAQTFQNSRDASQFFTTTEKNSHFLTLSCPLLRFHNNKSSVETQLKLARRDKQILSSIQTDTTFLFRLGLPFLEHVLLQLSWTHYQSQLPLGLHYLRRSIAAVRRETEEMRARADEFDASRLRPLAAECATEYLHAAAAVLGTSTDFGACGNKSSVAKVISVEGQTLDEEQEQSYLSLSDAIDRQLLEDVIPTVNKKLFGGQQFVRLLAEFKVVASNAPEIDQQSLFNDDDGVQNLTGKIWEAADVARVQSQEFFMPLIERLMVRASYVFGRIPHAVNKLLETSKAASYPFFTDTLDGYFRDFVDTVAKNTLSKCMDEFYSTKTLCWDLTEHTDVSDTREWAGVVYKRTAERITRNVLSKMYHFFLNPFEQELWTKIQSQVSCLSDDELKDLFKLTENKKGFEDTIKAKEEEINELLSQEAEYKKAANSFAYQK